MSHSYCLSASLVTMATFPSSLLNHVFLICSNYMISICSVLSAVVMCLVDVLVMSFSDFNALSQCYYYWERV